MTTGAIYIQLLLGAWMLPLRAPAKEPAIAVEARSAD